MTSRARKKQAMRAAARVAQSPRTDCECALCEREVAATTKHHLVPRQYGGEVTADLCRACHSQVHALYENKTLARELNTIDALRHAPEMARYLRWVRKQSDRKIKVRKAATRR